MFGATKPRDNVMLVTGAIVEFVGVEETTADAVTTSKGSYPRQHLRELVKPDGGRVFVIETDLPARVQAEEVRRLRQNAILGSLFSSRTPDITKVPWQLWVAMLILLLIVAFK